MSPQSKTPSSKRAARSTPPTPQAPASSSSQTESPVLQAHAFGQSIWLDNISRDLLLSGELRRWVEHEGIRGVTSNPAIFEKAIAKTRDYDPAARALIAQGASDALDVFERLAVADIQLGCDVLRPVWEESGGRDGFVSLEVSPHLANDTQGTIAEARRLSAAVSRDNLMIKVPATPEGVPAIQTLITEGIHVNVTLLFAVDAYEAVHQAYIAGLEARMAAGEDVGAVNSVASFFVSRIDAAVAQQIEATLENETREDHRERLRTLDAKVAIANAKLAYARFRETLASDRWKRLADAGAHPQRVLWASTGTKDPALPKTLYVDELIGEHTVNTLPDATLAAFREEGRVRDALGKDPEALKAEARSVLSELDALGISLKEITDQLLTKGCQLFSDAFDGLLLSVETKRQALLGDALVQTHYALGDAAGDVEAAAQRWQSEGRTRALWNRRAEIFSDADEPNWMGWLDLPRAAPETAIAWPALRDAIRNHPAETVVVVGMGGSSLFPDVLGRTLGEQAAERARQDGGARARRLRILDTTVPDAVEAFLAELDLARTLFIVSSKSGSTIETHAAFELIHARLVDKLGADAAGRHFVAITDPGSPLAKVARERGFLGTALGRPDVGGRFSALSPFGMLPAEAMGLDPEALLARARRMSAACAPFVSVELNPGVRLGIVLGTLARQGRDKLTLSTSPGLAAFPDWIEQLVAESTGKDGQGIVPIAGEPLLRPNEVGSDRVFVDLALAGDDARKAHLDALEAAGHPVVRIVLAEAADVVQEVFRWELATVVVGALFEQNPFDQPDVEAAKQAARARLAQGARPAQGEGAAPASPADLEADGLRFYVSPAYERGGGGDAQALVATALGRLVAGDCFRINAFLADAPEIRRRLQSIREAVARARHVATTLDFGPRYLHSTGQLQKGGPDRFVALQLWQGAESRAAAGASALAIPPLGGAVGPRGGAQAAGDFAVLAERRRRVIGIDLGPDAAAALDRLAHWVDVALA